MQLRHGLTTLLFALCCADTVVGKQALIRRQDEGGASTPTPTDGSVTTTSSTAESTPTSSGTTTQDTTATEDPKTTPTISTSPSEQTDISTKTGAAAGSPTKDKPEKDPLPIKPSITPAVGIAGVFLILSGVAYTIIGIKHQWLLVFLSTGYLAALGVTVLIIYVMKPPVSDAIQGAYMVAAVMTGVIFGGISLVFKEVTEGLGCLLGGFCVAMWFLVLKPGGLITDTTGKAIMIGVLSAVAWSLSFSQYTRSYGLIVCSSFAGATATVVGIDCFSRAGLKEFWIYVWDLNDDEFPLHTDTYPITRGIRVEIAATIIIFLFGLMSQFKIWKVVKERRTKKEAQRLEDEERRDQRDSRIGKRVESTNERSLAQWEAVYGDKDSAPLHADSGVGTSVDNSVKRSTSVTEREVDSIEMDDMGRPNHRSSKGARTSVTRVSSGEEARRVPELQLDFENSEYSWWADYKSSKSVRSKSKRGSTSSIGQDSLNGTRPPVPNVPAQFSTPMEQDEDARSGASNKTGQKTVDEPGPYTLAAFDDDRASSIAATLNEEPDMDALSDRRLSVAQSNYELDLNEGGLSPFADEFGDKSRQSSAPQTPGELAVDEDDGEMLFRPATSGGEQTKDMVKRASKKLKRKSTTRRKSADGSGSGKEDEAEESEGEVSVVGSLKAERLPESMSKLAMAYRTNEWAKHIAEADQPDADEVQTADEPGVQVEIDLPEEQPRALDPDALLEKAPMDPSGKLYKKPSTKPVRPKADPQQLQKKKSSSGSTPIYAFKHSNSHQSLQRQSSSNSVAQQQPAVRNFSAPLPLVESPTEADASASSAAYLSTTNLLDDRAHRVSHKPTTTSFAGISPSPNFNVTSPTPTPDDQDSDSTSQAFATPSEEIPLSQRRSLIQNGQIRPSTSYQDTRRVSRQRTGSNPSPMPGPGAVLSRMPSSSNYNVIYDSHQPRRSNTIDKKQQTAKLTQWRQSLQQESYAKPATLAEEQARAAMMQQRHQRGYREQKQQDAKAQRESMIDVAMRTGQLTSAHQNAMRKMQAKANDAAKPGAS